jgi:hypothetical protein
MDRSFNARAATLYLVSAGKLKTLDIDRILDSITVALDNLKLA